MFNRSTIHGQVAYWLMIVGGLNWGLIGVGYFFEANWNVVYLILGGIPYAEPVVYILVGVSAVIGIFGCRCTSCAVHMDTKPM